MEGIEEAFTLRQFHKALEGANRILSEKKLLTSKSCKGNDDGASASSKRDRCDNDNQLIFLDVPVFHFPESIPSRASKSTTPVPASLHFKVVIKLRSTNQQQESVGDFVAASAAVIAIQSSFELLKQRIQVRQRSQQHEQGKTVKIGNNKINEPCRIEIDEEIILHLQPFLQLYTTDSGNEYRITAMSFDVLVVFMKFLHAIGHHATCIEIIYSIIDQIVSQNDLVIPKEKKDTAVRVLDYGRDHDFDYDHMDHIQEEECDQNDLLWNYWYECFHLLFIDILPLIPNKEQCQLNYILNEFTNIMNRPAPKTIHRRNCSSKKKRKHRPYLKRISKIDGAPSLSSLQIISRSVQSLITHTHPKDNYTSSNINKTITRPISSIKKLIIQSLEDICYLLEEEISFFERSNDNAHAKKSKYHKSRDSGNTKNDDLSSPSLNNLSSIVDSLSSRLFMNENDNDVDDKDSKDGRGEENVAKRIARDYIIQPLWTSEERWLNRGKILSVGIATYSILWKP
eukprot:CAMPEP_0203683818 /NCGR_PEP_ID=MMETSP0090-20130426/47720_1 /ASSEMBLY_ACC=CAM_ASM_001088 /TAXON_ID=426623 /ORGANISM="Chaetoceros affinis, Strain CCMP159" /LENGTH=511 /DNA_ID=CAMNT_0050552973 /DNA_START=49 /DNA_END=1581 /DNA_ORIENTATION=-